MMHQAEPLPVVAKPAYFPKIIDIEGVGCVVMIFEVYGSGDHMVSGLYHMTGKINLPPKAWLRVVREQMGRIEQIARQSGVSELRIAGRDWSRILPDYEPFNEIPNGLRKFL